MKLREFEEKLQDIRSKNGWIINLEFNGIWVISIYEKETAKLLASTGSTGLKIILEALEIPFDKCPWV